MKVIIKSNKRREVWLTFFACFDFAFPDFRFDFSGTVLEGRASASWEVISKVWNIFNRIPTSSFWTTISTSESSLSLAEPKSVIYSVSSSLAVFGFFFRSWERFFGFAGAACVPYSSSWSAATAAVNLLRSLDRLGHVDDDAAGMVRLFR